MHSTLKIADEKMRMARANWKTNFRLIDNTSLNRKEVKKNIS